MISKQLFLFASDHVLYDGIQDERIKRACWLLPIYLLGEALDQM